MRIEQPDEPEHVGERHGHEQRGRNGLGLGDVHGEDPRGDAGTVSRRRLERPERPRFDGRRPQRHPFELRGVERHRRRRTAVDRADDRVGIHLRAAGRARGVPLALRPRRPLLALLVGVTNQNYLRGTQEADSSGRVTFTSIFPGCYSGRWPHIHFEVYPSLAGASSVSNKVATSQIALPKAACDEVYATSGYASSVTNLSQISLATDNVFSDGASLELATMSGSAAGGFTAALTVAV